MRAVDKVFDSLAHPTRRRILELLKQDEMSAGALAAAFDVSKPTMSAHFAKLRDAGLIRADQRGTSIVYSLNLSVLEEAMMGFLDRLGVGAKEGRQ